MNHQLCRTASVQWNIEMYSHSRLSDPQYIIQRSHLVCVIDAVNTPMQYQMIAILQTTFQVHFLLQSIFILGLLQWRYNGCDGVSDHQPYHSLLNRLFRHRSKKTSNTTSLAFVWGIHRWLVNSPHKWQSNAENVPIWWRHHVKIWPNFVPEAGSPNRRQLWFR